MEDITLTGTVTVTDSYPKTALDTAIKIHIFTNEETYVIMMG